MNVAREIHIAGRAIGMAHPPYVIAEMSANHNGSLEKAFAIIDAAKAAGADAVKIQTYRPETITLESSAEEFQIRGGLWDGRTLYELYQEAHMPWEWHVPLFERAKKAGLTIFSSPFDESAIDLLESLDAPAYKIASFEAIDLALIRRAAKTGKPLIISTGMADATEIGEAIEAAVSGGCKELAILRCVSGYPALASDYNLATIPDMISRFDCITGLSDHTMDATTAIASVALGAAIIEKHFTLDRCGGGPDDSFSIEPNELSALCAAVHTAWQARGGVDYGLKSSERANVQFRRSLYFVKDLAAGDVITSDAVRSVRPGFGAAPKYLETIIGRRVSCPVSANTPVKLELIVPEISS